MLDELLIALGYEYDGEDARKFNRDYQAINDTVNTLVTVAAAGAAALTGLVVATASTADETGKFANEIGIATEMVDSLTFAQERSGGSSSGMLDSLRNLTRASSEAARGAGEALEAFGLLGVSVRDGNGDIKNATDLFVEISGAMGDLDEARQIDLAGKLGLDNAIRLLQAGPEEIQNLVDEARALGVTTERDAAIAGEFNDQLTNIGMIGKSVARVITSALAPALTEVAQRVGDWWKANREVIEANIPQYLDMVTKGFRFMAIAMAAVLALRFAAALGQVIAMLRGVTVATLAANAAVLALPALIASAGALLLGLMQDAKVFFDGGDSLIGDLIERFPEYNAAIRNVAAAMAALYDTGAMVFEGWSMIIDLFKSFSFSGLVDTLKNLPGFLLDATGIRTVDDRINENLEFGQQFQAENQPSQTAFPVAQPTPAAFGNTNNTTNSRETNSVRVENINIEIPNATSPEETANELVRVIEQTTRDLTTTVNR